MGAGAEETNDSDADDRYKEFKLEDLQPAPAKLDDLRAAYIVRQDELLEVNLGTEDEPRPTYISKNLSPEMADAVMNILNEYRDCFAWDYSEMPGLDRNLVEHQLPIKEGFRPFKQPSRRMSPEIVAKVKEEIERLLDAGFIKPIRYTDWLSNIVPVIKKNGKLRVCIDFRNLNLATPKDEYPMPIADLLVDGTARHKIMSFMAY